MNNENDIADSAFEEFFSLVEKRQHEESKRNEQAKRIIAEKNQILIPIRKLLFKLMNAGLYVNNSGQHDYHLISRSFAPQLFVVYENESSPHYQPGSSIYFDHPVAVEIAVPNAKDRDQEGIIKISNSTPHPNGNLLVGPFRTTEEACTALVRFLSSSTIRIERGGTEDVE